MVEWLFSKRIIYIEQMARMDRVKEESELVDIKL
jgi:hypothetical protein